MGCVFRNDYWNDGSNRYGHGIFIYDSGVISGRVYEGFSASWNRSNKNSYDPVATLGDWHHFAVVFHSHNNMQLYWDGIEYDGYYDGTGSGMRYSSGDGVIGHFNGPNGVPYYYDGKIDDIRVYSRALVNDEILELYNEPNPVPIPSALWLLWSGIMGFIVCRNKFKD